MKKSILGKVCFILLSVALTACGSNSSSTNAGIGSISAQLDWSRVVVSSSSKLAATAPTGVATVRIIVSGSGMSDIQKDFDASLGQGVIDGVPAGSNRTVTAQGLDSTGVLMYQGSVSNMTVTAGHTTDVGTITMLPLSGGSSVTLIPGTAAQATLNTGGNTVNFNFAANAVNQQTVATLTEVTSGGLPVGISSKKAGFTLSPDNVFVLGFTLTTNPGITAFNVPVSMSGTLSSTSGITSGTTLNLAMLQNNTWVDVATIAVGNNGSFTENFLSTTLVGILTPGTYVLYKPAPGGSTTVSNLGIALVADDGNGSGNSSSALQVINLYDSNGNPLATPTIKYLHYDGAYDIDGQALTPDGSQGILVDGGNTIRFFSNVQTGVPLASTTTLDVSAYGGDGDSVAIMPNGDEAVVSADSSTELLLVSGIVSGNPKEATTIPIPGNRDGVVISNDGAVLLARGNGGLTVFSIAPVTPAPGTLGGMVSHSFTQTADITTLGSISEDGRNGIAISPKDSSRAVIVGSSSNTSLAIATLVTGVPGSPTVGTSVTISGALMVLSVAITPDGKTAIVGTDAGIAMLSGVDTGTLTQVGGLYAPTYAGSGGSVTMGYVPTLGVTLDGKFVVVCDAGPFSSSVSSGSLLVIPINATGFGAPVGILNGIAVPYNDQMVIH